MTSRIINIRIKENIGSTEMYLNEKLYTTQKNENQAFVYLLKDYFKDLLIQLNLNKKQLKLEFFDSNYKYYKEYVEGLDLYIPTDIGYQQVQKIFKAIGYNLKYVSSKNYVLECKRNLFTVEGSYFPPALYYSNIEEQYFLIAGSEINIPVGKKIISLEFDVLYIKKEIIIVEPKYFDDENSFRQNINWESYNTFTTDESPQKYGDDKQEKLF